LLRSPPPLLQAPPPPLLQSWRSSLASVTPADLERLIEAESNVDVVDPLSALRPGAWQARDARAYVLAIGDAETLVAASGGADDADADDDDDATASSSASLSEAALEAPAASLVELAVLWAFAQRPAGTFVAQLAALAEHTSFYYKLALKHVLASRSRATLRCGARRVARRAPNADDLLADVRRAVTGGEALARAMAMFFGASGNVWQAASVSASTVVRASSSAETLATRSCAATGYALVACFALLVCCQAHDERVRRNGHANDANVWREYTLWAGVAIDGGGGAERR
jgi:hypothetical protein